MADVKKFLNQTGVSTLWTQVANKIAADIAVEKGRAEGVEAELLGKINAEAQRADAAEKVNAKAIADEADRAKAAEKANADAIAVLNGAATVEGSVAYQIAEIVTANGGGVDKLEEIAAWIAAHPTDAAEYNQRITQNASDIDALELLVGSKSVATQISEAIAAEELNKYALASTLTEVSGALTTLKGTGQRLITTDEISKLSKLVLEGDNLSVSGSVAAGNVQGLTAAIDDRIATQVIALTADEIIAACGQQA